MKPHERLFVSMGFLTMLVIGISMPVDPDIDRTPTWFDHVFVWALIIACAYSALKAFLDMGHKRPRRTPPTYTRSHHKRSK